MCASALLRTSRCAGSSGYGSRAGEAELPEIGAFVGEKAVERVVEDRRYQPPHDQNSMVSDRLGTVPRLRTRGRLASVATA